MFYKLSENGKIEAISLIKRDETWLETNKNIIRGFDGKLYFEDEAPTKSLEELKAEKIVELKAEKIVELKVKRDAYKKANNYDNKNIVDNILIGLGNYTDEERLACKTFFNNLISRYDELKDLINNATLDTINSISITFTE